MMQRIKDVLVITQKERWLTFNEEVTNQPSSNPITINKQNLASLASATHTGFHLSYAAFWSKNLSEVQNKLASGVTLTKKKDHYESK